MIVVGKSSANGLAIEQGSAVNVPSQPHATLQTLLRSLIAHFEPHHVNAQAPSPANTQQSGPSRPSTEIEEDSRSPSDVVAISSPQQADLPTSSQPLVLSANTAT